jgi:hypothetical protein
MIRKEIRFKTLLEKYQQKGEKSGWTFLAIPSSTANKINPGVKKSFRVKGKLDEVGIEQVALIPIGEGNFILPVNQTLRKQLKKTIGEKVSLALSVDDAVFILSEDLLSCLQDEPVAFEQFKKLPPSHQRYFSKWIEEAKTISTKEKRIVSTIEALSKQKNFGEMLREQKKIT